MFNWISHNVLNFKVVIVASLLLAVGLAAQKGIAVVVRGTVITWEGSCAFKDWSSNEDVLGLVVDCGEKGTSTITTDRVIRSYLLNPGPLPCKLDLDNDIICESRTKKE